MPTEAYIELAAAFENFYYFALFNGSTEITDASTGAARAAGTHTRDTGTGIVTLSKTFSFNSAVVVTKVRLYNSGSAGGGKYLAEFVPDASYLPTAGFGAGGQLILSFTAQMTA